MKKNFLAAVLIFVSSVVGAGFSSGQEIVLFFSRHGKAALGGILCSGVLFSVFAYEILKNRSANMDKGYQDWLKMIFGRCKWLFDIITVTFLFFIFSLMLTGAQNIIADTLNISSWAGMFVIIVVCVALLAYGESRVNLFATWTAPIQIIGILLTCLIIIFGGHKDVFGFDIMKKIMDNAYVGSFQYAGYNSLLCIGILSNIPSSIIAARKIEWAGVVGGVVIGALIFIVHMALGNYYIGGEMYNMPLLKVAWGISQSVGGAYSAIVLISMIISIILSGELIIKQCKSVFPISRTSIIFLLITISLVISNLGFSKIMEMIYPLFGYVGVVVLVWTMIRLILDNRVAR